MVDIAVSCVLILKLNSDLVAENIGQNQGIRPPGSGKLGDYQQEKACQASVRDFGDSDAPCCVAIIFQPSGTCNTRI